MSSTTISPLSAEQSVLDVLKAAGFYRFDGWFYPPGNPSRAVVRLQVADGTYQIWRRRRLTSDWLRIVGAPVEDFDQDAFSTWRNSWPLTR